MIPLAIGIAVPDEHTRFAHLKSSAHLLAAVGAAAAGRRHYYFYLLRSIFLAEVENRRDVPRIPK